MTNNENFNTEAVIVKKGGGVAQVFKNLALEPFTLYRVMVKASPHNVEHESFLFAGYSTGAYCEVYTHTYEEPIPLGKVHSIRILEKLCNTKAKNGFKS